MDNLAALESPQLRTLINKYSPFFIEIRKRIVFTLAVFALATIIGFVFYESIIRFLIEILGLRGINIVFTSPFQYINLAISCGLAAGLVLSFPLLTVQVLFFVKPALRAREYKMVVRFLPFSFILFLLGFISGAMIMKWQIDLFLERSISIGIGNVLDISHLLNTILLTSTLMGVSFQFPIVVLLLLRLGIVKHNQLASKRVWIYLISFIFAILLPVDSILADVLLSLPLIILFELTLLLDRIFDHESTP